MRRALAAGVITVLAAGLPAGSALAHPCPCFPPGAWMEADLPSDLSDFRPEAATPVADGVLVFGVRGEEVVLDPVLLTFPGPGMDPSGTGVAVIPLDVPVPDGGQPTFIASDGSTNDVLLGGAISPPDSTGLGQPFVLVSNDGGRTWQDPVTSDIGLDLLIDGTPHAGGFALSGSVERDGKFRPAVTQGDGQTFGSPVELGAREGFGISITTGPGDDTISVGGVVINDKGDQRPVVFTHADGATQRTNLPGADGTFPVDIVASGNDIVVSNNEGQILHASEPGGKFRQLKGLKGSMIHAFGGGLDPTLLAFGKDGAAFSFDGGDSWARTHEDGIADAGTVKATGARPDGGLFAFARGEDGLGRLFLADGPPQPVLDPQLDFARMMAGFFVRDLFGAVGGVPTPEFVSEVTSHMQDVMAEYQADESLAFDGEVPATGPAEGASAREIAENFVARLVAAGGSVPAGDFIFTATGEIHAAYETATAE